MPFFSLALVPIHKMSQTFPNFRNAIWVEGDMSPEPHSVIELEVENERGWEKIHIDKFGVTDFFNHVVSHVGKVRELTDEERLLRWRKDAGAERFIFKIAAHEANKLEAIRDTIADADMDIQLAYAEASFFPRNGRLVRYIVDKLDLADEDVDQLFRRCEELEKEWGN